MSEQPVPATKPDDQPIEAGVRLNWTIPRSLLGTGRCFGTSRQLFGGAAVSTDQEQYDEAVTEND